MEIKPVRLLGLLLSLMLMAVALTLTAVNPFSPTPAHAEEGPLFDQTPQGKRPLSAVSRVSLPAVDVAALTIEDEARLLRGDPPRFAAPIPVTINPDTHGDWETLGDGSLLWRLRVSSPGAVSLNLAFGQYWMPADGRLYLYTPDYTNMIRPFTAADNADHGELWTPLLEGEEVVIAVTLPATQRPELRLTLTAVNYGYRPFGQSILSGACNVDVVCPEGDDWRDQIRSVGVISTGGGTFCTGFMVNNTAQDLTPYFMTARHCGIGAGNAASLVVYWNYENSFCRPPGSPASGGPGDGVLNQFNTGSYFRASYLASDMTLVELVQGPDPAFEVYWAGWDATSADAEWAVAIHHPNTDEKRISFEYEPTTTTSYLGTAIPGDGTHIRVEDWDLGTTEPGSSGSPLFNQDKRVIGQLHGGYAACGNDLADWYGRVSISWTGGGSSATRLSDWLDPLNTGALVLDGRDLTPFNIEVAPTALDVCQPDNALFTINAVSNSGFDEAVTLSLTGAPGGTAVNFNPNPLLVPGMSQLTISDIGAAVPGSYSLSVSAASPTDTVTVNVGLHLAVVAPGAVSLQLPANGAVMVSPQPTFVWTAVSEASRYAIEIATDSGFTNIVHTAANLTGGSYVLPGSLQTSVVYYWRVRAENGCGLGAYSAVYSFTTEPAPGDCGPEQTPVMLYSQDFEAGAPGWSSGGTANSWTLSTVRSHSGQYAYYANAPSFISDQRLVSPPVTLPDSDQLPITLQFWNYQRIEPSSGGCFDGAIVEISTNGGGSWSQIGNERLLTDPYDGVVSSSYSNPLAGQPAWCGDPQDWLNSIVDLNAYAGETVQFRFRLGTDSSVSREGWYIDDVVVRACEAPAAPNPDLITSGDMSGAGAYGRTITYTVVLTNTGDTADTFAVSLGDHEWTAVAEHGSVGPLAPGQSGAVNFHVAVGHGREDSVVVTFTSGLDAAVKEEVTLHSYTHLMFAPMIMN